MKIKTLESDSILELKQKLSTNITSDFKPNIAIVFASVELEIVELCELFDKENIKLYGCTTCGEFLYNEKEQLITDGSLVCLLMDLLPGTFNFNLLKNNNYSSIESGKQIGLWAKESFKNPGLIILASGLETDGEMLVRGIQNKTNDTIKMFGGLAGDDAKFNKTYVFTNDGMEENSVLAMVLDLDFYEMNGIASSGWVGIGADKIITKSEGNIVYTIDNEPALDVYKTYLNVADDDLPEIGIEFPLLLKNVDRQHVLRAVLNVDKEKKSLIFAGSVPQGSVVSFSSSPGFEIIEFTKNNVAKFYELHKQTDLLILFSCMARHNALGPTISEEIEDAWRKWNVPLIGFFTYGEIGNNFNSTCDFHNQTFTLVSIKQKDNAI
ncbi:MAG: FIST N-terminal domain-containing protein [Bacteroidota bacterium]